MSQKSNAFPSTMNKLTEGHRTDCLTTFFYEGSTLQLQITDEGYDNQSTVIFFDKEAAVRLIEELKLFVNE